MLNRPFIKDLELMKQNHYYLLAVGIFTSICMLYSGAMYEPKGGEVSILFLMFNVFWGGMLAPMIKTTRR